MAFFPFASMFFYFRQFAVMVILTISVSYFLRVFNIGHFSFPFLFRVSFNNSKKLMKNLRVQNVFEIITTIYYEK